MKTTHSLLEELEKFRNREVNNFTLNKLDFPIIKIEKSTSILDRLKVSDGTITNAFNFEKLETNKIFHINNIRKISIDYRLRFLDTKYYKNQYPEHAIESIRNFENIHNTEINHFKIVAPKGNFKLDNYDDPLLFMSLGNDYYYLLDSWGKDMHWSRKIMAYPTKNLSTLLLGTFIFSILLTFCVNLLKTDTLSVPYQIVIFLFTWKSIIAIVFYAIIQSGNNVSEFNWNSQFYNK